MFWIVLLAYVILLFLLCWYLLGVRNPSFYPVSDRVRRVIVFAAGHPDFHAKCVGMCKVAPEEFADFQRLIGEAEHEMPERQLEFFTSNRVWGGWASLHPQCDPATPTDQQRYVLALPCSTRLPGEWLHAIAIHELFHLIRHIHGDAPFASERPREGRRWWEWVRDTWNRMMEELIVWLKSFQVAPIGTTALFLPWLILVIVIASSPFLIWALWLQK